MLNRNVPHTCYQHPINRHCPPDVLTLLCNILQATVLTVHRSHLCVCICSSLNANTCLRHERGSIPHSFDLIHPSTSSACMVVGLQPCSAAGNSLHCPSPTKTPIDGEWATLRKSRWVGRRWWFTNEYMYTQSGRCVMFIVAFYTVCCTCFFARICWPYVLKCVIPIGSKCIYICSL